jgi:formate hydrogenlyase subunit 3/multisubunit Na+/H+ antiporter MnhD subunit
MKALLKVLIFMAISTVLFIIGVVVLIGVLGYAIFEK